MVWATIGTSKRSELMVMRRDWSSPVDGYTAESYIDTLPSSEARPFPRRGQGKYGSGKHSYIRWYPQIDKKHHKHHKLNHASRYTAVVEKKRLPLQRTSRIRALLRHLDDLQHIGRLVRRNGDFAFALQRSGHYAVVFHICGRRDRWVGFGGEACICGCCQGSW